MIYEQPLRAVNPTQLAILTGTTKIRRFAAPMPAVVRPVLLTDRLRGPSCCSNCSELTGYDSLGGMIPPDYGVLRGWGRLGQGPTLDINNLGVPSSGSGNTSLLQTIASGANSAASTVTGIAAQAAQFIPGIGEIASEVVNTFDVVLNELTGWLGIGAGRQEANLIVPVQNQVMAALGNVTNQILTGSVVSVATLQGLYRTVWQYGVGFQEFVLLNTFTDRRASGQALNTVMPYIDGSCGYPVPVASTATPGKWNCLTWGAGTIGGPGTNGMLGAITRAIQAQGGALPVLPDVHQTANSGITPQSVSMTTTGGSIFGSSSSPLTIVAIAAAVYFLVR